MSDPSSAQKPNGTTRRRFIRQSVAAMAGLSIVPRHVLGGAKFVPPSEKVAVACIGVGSQGLRVMMSYLRQQEVQVLAVCDANSGSDDYVEWFPNELRNKVRELLGDSDWGSDAAGPRAGMRPAQQIVQRYYAAQRGQSDFSCAAYTDYRELLERERGVDAVITGTPDHLHAVIAIDAMNSGRHVYSQKPMCHTVAEARRMAEVAHATGLATQVATGNSASEATRRLAEWVWDGAIGPVREVHNWSSRPFWPQGMAAPAEGRPAPDYLNWDLWLGPAAQRPYHPSYQPFIWRGWVDFGTGSIGDMGCYSFDTIFRVLKLTAPVRVEASSTERHEASYPQASIIRLHFPARDEMPPVTVHWYDGGLKPPKPDELGDAELDDEGMLLVGDGGKILCGFNGSRPRLIPEAAMEAYEQPPKTLPRSIGHEEEWIAACKGGEPAGAHFGFAARVTEAILLGNVALRTGRTLHWDSAAMRITNDAAANDLLRMPYREGWEI